MLVTLARWLAPDFFGLSKRDERPVLITIPYSHFVELGRWALQLKGRDFIEYDYAPMQHILPVLSARVGGREKHLSRSSRIERPQDESDETEPLVGDSAHSDKTVGAPTAVPLLVLPNGGVLTDSWQIGAAAGLAPIEDAALLALYDEQLGPLSRQWAYHHLLKPSNARHWDSLITSGRHWLWRLAYRFVLRGPLRAKLTGAFRTDDADACALCRTRLRALLARLGEARVQRARSPDGGFCRYLNGETVTLEDVALAALAAPLVCPPGYCEGRFNFVFDAVEASDSSYRAEVEEWRRTDVGQYALWFYEQHRMRPLPAAEVPARMW